MKKTKSRALHKRKILPGSPVPFGATLTAKGVQFSLFSRNATSVTLLLFKNADDEYPEQKIVLNPEQHRSGDCWHVFIENIHEGQFYLYSVDGPYEPQNGHRFNKNCLLIDPYTKALSGSKPWQLNRSLAYKKSDVPNRDLSFAHEVNGKGIPKCVVVDDHFDWQGDRPLNYPLSKTIIYETHVKGFTRHPNTVKNFNLKHAGTFSGIVEMIPYLKELGITSIELLPVFEFDEREYGDQTLTGSTGLKTNYWGYSTIAFFAPKGTYSRGNDGPTQVKEFKTMVRELHKAGIEVILDVVFNHTGEGNQLGPTLSFRGLDNSIYYMLDQEKRYYRNYSGCGNTVNGNHPLVQGFILDSLRYWVIQMHVDGFRFDLASVLSRDSQGRILENPPILESIAQDPVLRDTKIIAEAWDAGGAYQVGHFPGGRWAEWNDRFRNDIRSFWRGDTGQLQDFVTRVSGSSDLYAASGRKPYHSINYVTAHDGFTLFDLVHYNEKHNEANGENNADGSNNNLSCNWGIEGECDSLRINTLRARMLRNFWATLLISSGTPMILGGDEFLRTQKGNNNAYCQDNPVSWYDFNRLDQHSDFFRFAREVIAFRKRHLALQRREFFLGTDNNENQIFDITWFNKDGRPVNWESQDNIFGMRIDGSREEILYNKDDSDIIVFFNSTEHEIDFTVPEPYENQSWYRVIDTAREAPDDIREPGTEVPVDETQSFCVDSQSMAVLISLCYAKRSSMDLAPPQ